MRKIFAMFFGLTALPTFAEIYSPFYDEAEGGQVSQQVAHPHVGTVVQQPSRGAVGVSPGAATQSRAAATPQARTGTNRQAPSANQPGSRAVASRAATTQAVRTAPGGAADASTPTRVASPAGQGVVARAAANQNRGGIQSRATTRSQTAANAITGTAPQQQQQQNNQPTTSQNVVARQVNQGPEVNVARIGMSGGAIGARAIGARAATGTIPTMFDPTPMPAPAGPSAEEVAAQTDFCRAQYASCMDSFCNVLDDAMGRCSCSAEIDRYEAAEAMLRAANEELQQVATQISYLGLSRDEVATLFTQTEAERELQAQGTDNTQIRQNLDDIQRMLMDPRAATVTEGGLLQFNFDSLNLGDIFNFGDFGSLFGGGGGQTVSIQSQRGAALFTTATQRCRSIVTQCSAQGVDSELITASYDLEIDRQCIAFERSLTDANEHMRMTIRNATNVLQQARLMVAQNRNRLDLRGCVNALDSCMQDEFVCGRNYNNCLDATGMYDDPVRGAPGSFIVNGSVVVGETVPATLEAPAAIQRLLLNRIGIIDPYGRAMGLCSGVMNQCQQFSRERPAVITTGDDPNGQFITCSVVDATPITHNSGCDNQVLTEYLVRTVPRILARQAEVISAHADICIRDVSSCFNRNQGNQGGNVNTAASACSNQIATCASVLGMHNNVRVTAPGTAPSNIGIAGICSGENLLRCTLPDSATASTCTNWVCGPPQAP